MERWLTLRFLRKSDGHEVAWAQLLCKPEPEPKPEPEGAEEAEEAEAAAKVAVKAEVEAEATAKEAAAGAGALLVEEQEDHLVVRGSRLEVTISRRLGLPSGVALDGV